MIGIFFRGIFFLIGSVLVAIALFSAGLLYLLIAAVTMPFILRWVNRRMETSFSTHDREASEGVIEGDYRVIDESTPLPHPGGRY